MSEREGLSLLRAAAGTVVAPKMTLERLSRMPSMRRSALAVGITGGLWASFAALLAWQGRAPSGPLLLPIARDAYYRFEALVLIPLFFVLWAVGSFVGARTARALDGVGSAAATRSVMAFALAVPSLFGWLLPDALVLATLGFEAMGRAMRGYVPLTALWTLALMAAGLKSAHQLGWGRALLAGVAGYLAQSLIAAPIFR